MTYLFNLLDLCFTLCANAPEANPLMQNIGFMVVYKVIVIGVLCWWLNKREEKIARVGLLICTFYYGIVNIYHIFNLFGG
jgi:hypothetical protein